LEERVSLSFENQSSSAGPILLYYLLLSLVALYGVILT